MMLSIQAGKYILLCSSVLLLAACASGTRMSGEQRQYLQQLTPKERDALGRETANVMRSRSINTDKNAEVSMQGIDYRARDDAFVYRVRVNTVATPNSMTRAQRSQLHDKFKRDFRRTICRDRSVGDMVRHGNYAIELRVSARNGGQLTPPVRITKADC